jgi:cytochrome c peroxidase
MSFRLPGIVAVAVALLAVGLHERVLAFPVDGDQTALPPKTELNEDALRRPREVFHSEIVGRRSDLIKLGNLAFSSPSTLGLVAQRAGVSCETCHVNGAGNAKFFMPKMSTRPGNFDTTGALFNPKADNGVLDPVRIPSLRGARYLAPYGADGRMASLRDFVRNVIVNEFAGAEPTPQILDAMVAYIQDIDFLPNPSLGPAGRLVSGRVSEAERRGEAVFLRPFPHDPAMSCATCHVPSAAFVDHQQHDVASGGLFKTPTLRNADFNAPYFHDGRFDTFDQVVAHFDRVFELGLSTQDQKDLVAYLTAVGDGLQPYEQGAGVALKEINDFASLLGSAIPAGDEDVVALAVDTIGAELRELTEHYPDRKDTSVSGGDQERANARAALKSVVLLLRRIDMAVGEGRTADAAVEYRNYRNLMAAAIPSLLAGAERWSLFNSAVHDQHYEALRQVMQSRHMSQ